MHVIWPLLSSFTHLTLLWKVTLQLCDCKSSFVTEKSPLIGVQLWCSYLSNYFFFFSKRHQVFLSVFWRNARRHSLNKLLHVEMHALVFARSKWDCAYCRETESMRSNLHKSWPFWKNNVPLNLTLNTLYYLYIGDSHRDLIREESYSLEGVKVSFEKCDKNVSITVTSSLQSTGGWLWKRFSCASIFLFFFFNPLQKLAKMLWITSIS